MKNTENETKTQTEIQNMNPEAQAQGTQTNPEPQVEAPAERTAEQAAQRMIASRFRKNHLAKVVDIIDTFEHDEKQRFTLKPQFTKQQVIDSLAWVGKVGEVVNTKIPAFGFIKLAFKVSEPLVKQDYNITIKSYPATNKYAFEGQSPVKFDPERFDRDLAFILTRTGCYEDSTAIPLRIR